MEDTLMDIPMVVQCCVCEYFRDSEGHWNRTSPVGECDISHGYCPKCLEVALRTIKKEGEKDE